MNEHPRYQFEWSHHRLKSLIGIEFYWIFFLPASVGDKFGINCKHNRKLIILENSKFQSAAIFLTINCMRIVFPVLATFGRSSKSTSLIPATPPYVKLRGNLLSRAVKNLTSVQLIFCSIGISTLLVPLHGVKFRSGPRNVTFFYYRLALWTSSPIFSDSNSYEICSWTSPSSDLSRFCFFPPEDSKSSIP